MDSATRLIHRLYELLGEGDVERASMLYAPDAEIIRYDGVATSLAEIKAFWSRVLDAFPGAKLHSLDRVRAADDVIMWDALIDTHVGVLQTVDVVIVDDEGRISRHIPGIRGFWGG